MQSKSKIIYTKKFADRDELVRRDVYRIAIGMLEQHGFTQLGDPIVPEKANRFVHMNNDGEEARLEYARIYKDKHGQTHIVYFPGTDIAAKDRHETDPNMDLETIKRETLDIISRTRQEVDLSQCYQHFFVAESREFKKIKKPRKHFVYAYLHENKLYIKDSTINLFEYEVDGIVDAVSAGENEKVECAQPDLRNDQSSFADTCGHFAAAYFDQHIQKIQNIQLDQPENVVVTDNVLTKHALLHQQVNPAKYNEILKDGYFDRHYIAKNVLLGGLVLLGIAGLVVASVASVGLLPMIVLIVGAVVGGVLVVSGTGFKLFDIFRCKRKEAKLVNALKEDGHECDGCGTKYIIRKTRNNAGLAHKVVEDDFTDLADEEYSEGKVVPDKTSEPINPEHNDGNAVVHIPPSCNLL